MACRHGHAFAIAECPQDRTHGTPLFTQGLSYQDGSQLDSAQIGMPPDFPKAIRPAVEFKAKGDRPILTIMEYDRPVGQRYVCSLAGTHQ